MSNKLTYWSDASLKGLLPHEVSFVHSASKLKSLYPSVFNTIFSRRSNQIISRPVIDKIGWWVLDSDVSKFNLLKLDILHILFLHHKFTRDNAEKFKGHFIGDNRAEGLICLTCEIQVFILLFEKLVYEHKVIPRPPESLYKILPKHFSNNGKKLSEKSLKSSLNSAKANPLTIHTVENFIALLLG